MPQMDFSTYPTQLFWLAVTFIVLYGLMKWLALPRVGAALEARRRHLDDDLGRAASLRQEAESVLAAYEKGRAAARAEAQAQLRQTAEKMAAEAAERQRRLGEALTADIAAAERRIAASKEAALSDIRGIAGDVGRAMVEKLTGAAPDARRMAAAVESALAGRRG